MTTEQLPPNAIKDASGRVWLLVITVGIYTTLRDKHGINLFAEDALSDVMTDPVKRSEVLIATLDQQAKSHGLTSGDVDVILCSRTTAPPAHVALEAALEDFYETQGLPAMTGVMKSAREAQRTLQNTAMARINSPQMAKMISREIKKAERAMDAAMAKAEAQQETSESESGYLPSSPSVEQPTGEISPLASSVEGITQSASIAGAIQPSSTAPSSPQ